MRDKRKFEDIERDFPSYFPNNRIRCLKCVRVDEVYKGDRFRSFMIPHMKECYSGVGVMRECFEWEVMR